MAGILDLLGLGQKQPQNDPMGLMSQFGFLPPDMAPQQPPQSAPVNPLFQQLNRGPDGMPYGLPGPQGSAPAPMFTNPDIPAPNAMTAGPAPMQGSPMQGSPMPPMPPVRPEGLGMAGPLQLPGARPPDPVGAVAMQSPAATPPQNGMSGIDKFGGLLRSIYGGGGPGDSLMALGAGLMSGPNAGAGMLRGMAMSNANSAMADQRNLQRAQAQQKLLGLQGGVETLRKAFPGRSEAEYASWAQQPQIIQEALKRTAGAFTGPPQLVDVQNPDGSTSKQWLTPGQTSGPAVTSIPAPPGLPPGADPKRFREAQATKAAEEAQTNRQKQEASDITMPYIDRAYSAYKRLGEMGAIGPVQASGLWRTAQGSFGAEAEKLRQDYEASAKQLELTKAQIMMKGQGQITENERKILQMTLPRLDAADSATGLKTLEMLRSDFMKSGRPKAQGRADPLGIR